MNAISWEKGGEDKHEICIVKKLKIHRTRERTYYYYTHPILIIAVIVLAGAPSTLQSAFTGFKLSPLSPGCEKSPPPQGIPERCEFAANPCFLPALPGCLAKLLRLQSLELLARLSPPSSPPACSPSRRPPTCKRQESP